MKTIFFNVPGSPGGGGPSVFVYKTAQILTKYGFDVRYDKPHRADVALCIIETGKTLAQINKQKTRVVLRTNGIYCREYWHGGSGRQWRSDMTALHEKLKIDIPAVDHLVYQSRWSKDRLDEEIATRTGNWSIIHNGVDTELFQPSPRPNNGFLNLFHIGKMRNGYIMESLIGTYKELEKRGHKTRLIVAGNMDQECEKVFSEFISKTKDPNVVKMGPCPNTKAASFFGLGDIYLGPRMGSSCDNVIAEALACGLPVVVPTWGGNAELFENGKQGIAVESGGRWNYGESYVQKLADGVEQILPDLDGFRTRARKHAVEELTINKMIDKYLKAMNF